MNDERCRRFRTNWLFAIVILGSFLTFRCTTVSNNGSTTTLRPDISDLIIGSSNALKPGESVEIWINITVADANIPVIYTWNTKEGEIIKGQGTSNILYKAPHIPGFYQIDLRVNYADWVENRSALISVQSLSTSSPESTPIPSKTPLSTRTVLPTTTLTIEPILTATTEPLSEPTIEPTPILPEAVVISKTGLNLRSGPGIGYDIKGLLRNGDVLDVQGRIASNEWIQVISDSPSTTTGWVSAAPSFVEINVDLTAIPIVTPPPLPPPTPTSADIGPSPVYAAPIPISPDAGQGAFGTFPPLTWEWNRELGEDEYFEVRVWHESITDYKPALGWVKEPPVFDYNISGEKHGRYFWSVVIVTDKPENVRFKDWYRSDAWPYPVWEHNPDIKEETWQYLSQESEIRFFNFTPSGGGSSGPGSPVSEPPFCGEPPC